MSLLSAFFDKKEFEMPILTTLVLIKNIFMMSIFVIIKQGQNNHIY